MAGRVGTRISFELTEQGPATRLMFVHHGLTDALDCHEICAGGWDFFLRVSLRRLLETGRGAPYARLESRA